MSLQPPAERRRKFSFPATLHHNLLGLPERTAVAQGTARRRLSSVSGAVSRKLSTTIGWRSNSVATADVVAQGKTLCGQYIRCRLKRSNVFNRKCGLQRLCSVVSLPGGLVVREVFPELLSVGLELERLHPSVYSGVGRQASVTPILGTPQAVGAVLLGVAQELGRAPSWARIVSLFAVAGGLAVDCVRQGHPELLQPVVEAMGQALDFHFADWIAHHGGWTGFLTYCKPPADNDISVTQFVGLVAGSVSAFLLLLVLLRWFGRSAFF